MGYNHGHSHRRRGSSSFFVHDPELVFGELKLKEGDLFLDLGCGVGDYSLQAAKIVGVSGLVYALDIREELLDGLAEEADLQGLKNIRTKVSDINSPLAITDNCIDVCFIATVLHLFNLNEDGKILFNEIHRVLKPDGRLAIIECKKEDLPFGPPIHLRNSPEELEAAIIPYGFEKFSYVNLGYNYMIQFDVKC
jgi:ubiquinone/menaquinone biosynthesis C-methylase UbiE